MASKRELDSFFGRQENCETLFMAGFLVEGMRAWEEACQKISEHVERERFLALQNKFIAALQKRGLDNAANEVRDYKCKDALAVLIQNKRAPQHRTSTTDDVERTKSPQQHYSIELGKLNQTSQAYVFGEPESIAAHSSVSLGHHPGISRTASAPVTKGSREDHEIDGRQVNWKQQRSQTAPVFTSGVPLEEGHERASGWRHTARKVYASWHHEEKGHIDEDGTQQA